MKEGMKEITEQGGEGGGVGGEVRTKGGLGKTLWSRINRRGGGRRGRGLEETRGREGV